VSAVVFGPDLAIHPSHPRIGLVLGAGGVLGAAWMTGALACLQDRLPEAAADVDLVVGTSAGSVVAAALRCRASLEEMVAWQCGDVSGVLGESAALAAKDGPLPPLPHLRLGSLPLARAALQEADEAKRDEIFAQAWRISLFDDVGYIPLHQQALAWGVSKKVKITQRADNQVLFYWATKQE